MSISVRSYVCAHLLLNPRDCQQFDDCVPVPPDGGVVEGGQPVLVLGVQVRPVLDQELQGNIRHFVHK